MYSSLSPPISPLVSTSPLKRNGTSRDASVPDATASRSSDVHPRQDGVLEIKPHALLVWDEIASLMRNKTLAIFLDYDGTLTPIVQNPQEAQISVDMRRVVETVASKHFVAVVTGRSIATITGSHLGCPRLARLSRRLHCHSLLFICAIFVDDRLCSLRQPILCG